MTAPRWTDERAPVLVETDIVPITLTLFSDPGQRQAYGKHVYVEMVNPSGLHYLVVDASIERSHDGQVFMADCTLDAFGSWYLTWHGLSTPGGRQPESMRVDVVEVVC